MRIAIPVAAGRLCPHFGHCEHFALFDIDRDKMEVVARKMETPPPHEPGVLPRWLAEQGATVILAGGMGQRAQSLFQAQNITVVVGAPSEEPEAVVGAYLSGQLKSGENFCDH